VAAGTPPGAIGARAAAVPIVACALLTLSPMPSTILPAVIGIAPQLTVAMPLAALGPIVWAGAGLVVLLLALHITRSGSPAPLGWRRNDPPLRDVA